MYMESFEFDSYPTFTHILTAACSAVARECVTLSAGALERSGCADANVLTVMIACRA